VRLTKNIEYISSSIRHIMTVVAGLNIVPEGTTLENALSAFIANIGSGDSKSLVSAGIILIVLAWSVIEKNIKEKEVKTLNAIIEGESLGKEGEYYA
jgi:hypothetical protein